LRAGLRDLGYEEGKHFVFEFKWADGSYGRLPELAADLVRLKIDVLVTYGTPGTQAAKQATTTIPIVMAIAGDAIATGVIVSLARPGANVTGLTNFSPELCAKRLELLKEAFPRTKRVAIVLNPNNPVSRPNLQATKLTAMSLGLELHQLDTRVANDIERVFAAMATIPVDSVSIFEDGMLLSNARSIATHALTQRLPSVGFLDLAEAGGLMAYGASFPDAFRRAAVFVDKVLKGASPNHLPVEQPTKFKLVLNLKSAKALRLEFPPTLLSRADQVIE
jgi:putative ABC transport system substrate-binding protein